MIKVNNETVPMNRFPDGTLHIKGNPQLQYGTVLISWHYQDDSEFMAVAFLTKYYQARNNDVDLYLPYVPNARMDRTEKSEDVFTMKYFGEMINSLNFRSVYVMDVHSNVAIAAIQRVRWIPISNCVNMVLQLVTRAEGQKPLVFFPDEGAMKRYSKNIRIPFAFGMKKRDWQSGNILGLEVLGIDADAIKGKPVLIQDDICSKGGTFYYAAKKLKEMGAGNIYLLVTHCEKSIHKGEFGENKVNLHDTGLISKVFTTNSTYDLGESDWIHVVNVDIVMETQEEMKNE